MTYEKMSQVIDDTLEDIIKTRDAGQKEYARTDINVFANFERVAEQMNVPREKVLMTYFLKHVDGISAYINGHKSQREDVYGRIIDAIVYLLLLRGMLYIDEHDNS